jgi:hypothetical protein
VPSVVRITSKFFALGIVVYATMLALVTFVEPTPHEYVVQIALRPKPDTRPGQVLPSAGRLAGVQAPESALVNTLEAFPFAR